MKILLLSCCAAIVLMGCQNKAAKDINEDDVNAEDSTAQTPAAELPVVTLEPALKPAPIKVPLDGTITISPEPLISERSACILPLRVSNGTEDEVSVSMFDFKVTGLGKPDAGNMFAQPTPSGQARTARIILIGQSCEAFDTVTISEVLCVSGDTICPVIVDFEDSAELKLIGPN